MPFSGGCHGPLSGRLPPGRFNRIALAYLMFVNMLVRSDNDGVSASDGDAFPQRIRDCLEMAASALAAPAPGNPSGPA